MTHLTSRIVLDDSHSASVFEAKRIGKTQFEKFNEDRILSDTASLYDIIHKNNLGLFRSQNSIVTSKSKQKIVSLKSDRQLYSNLFIACQSRDGDLDNFFAHENHAYPVSLSEYGRIRPCTSKSDLLECLAKVTSCQYLPPKVDMKVIDGPALVNMNPPKGNETFGNYCQNLVTKTLSTLGRGLKRLDTVFDVYRKDSLKAQTRENRGPGIRVLVRENTPVLHNFKSFMRDDQNKTELFAMFARKSITLSQPTIVSTIAENVLSNRLSMDTSKIAPCNHEEADTRLLLHAKDGSSKGTRKIRGTNRFSNILTLKGGLILTILIESYQYLM